MGGGDLNLKKSWHPHTLKNQERVWKAEQQKAEEDRKMAELQREIKEEREREMLLKTAEDSGAIEKKGDAKLDWMYKGPGGHVSREEYLCGRKIDSAFEQMVKSEVEEKGEESSSVEQQNKPVYTIEHEINPESVVRRGNDNLQVDMRRKLLEDPLLLIRQREEETKREITANPVKMKQLQQLISSIKSKKSKKKKKKNKKKAKAKKKSVYRSDSSDSDERSKSKKKVRKRSVSSSDSSSSDDNRGRKKKVKKIRKRSVSSSSSSSDGGKRKKSKTKRKRKSSSSDSSDDSSDSSSSSDDSDKRRQKKSKELKKKRIEPEDNRRWKNYADKQDNRTLNKDQRYGDMEFERRFENRGNESYKKDNRGGDRSRERYEDRPRNQYGDRPRSQYEDRPRNQSNYYRNERNHNQYSGKYRQRRDHSRSRSRSHSRDRKYRDDSRNRDDQSKGKQKLSEREMEKRRQEMMDAARRRDEDRRDNVQRYAEERRREEEMEKDVSGFRRSHLLNAASRGSIEDRVKSRVSSMQRGSAHMESNFARK